MRRLWSQEALPAELSAAFLARRDPLHARHHAAAARQRFLRVWAALPKLATAARVQQLQSVQRVVELEEFSRLHASIAAGTAAMQRSASSSSLLLTAGAGAGGAGGAGNHNAEAAAAADAAKCAQLLSQWTDVLPAADDPVGVRHAPPPPTTQ
jgi:hypothetical protein